MRKYLKKSLKIFLWTLSSVVALFLFLVLVIQIPSIQNFVKEKVVTYIVEKIHTKVTIDKIEIGLPKKIILEGFYIEDQKKDTLFAGEKLAVDISLFKLLNNKVEINSVQLKGVIVNINRDENAVFNFDYIIKAFTSPNKPKDDPVPLQFSVDKINLDRIKLKYTDAVSKNDFKLKLNHFETRLRTFDLEQMNFDIPTAEIDGLRLYLKQGLAQKSNETKAISQKNISVSDFKLKLGKIDLSKIDIYYENESTKLITKFLLQKTTLKFNTIDLKNQLLDIENIAVSDIKGNLVLGKLDKLIPKKEAVANEPNNWEINIKKTNFKQINFRFDDENTVALKKGIDYRHLNLQNLNFNADNLNYNPVSISGNINSFTVKDQSGLEIQSLKTDFFYGKKNTSLKKLYLKTPQTVLKDEIIIGYPSIEFLSENLGELDIKASLNNSKLGFKDILLFVPTLANTDPFKSDPNAILLINAKVSGKLKNIEIPNLEMSGIGTTKITASGKITGLPDVKKAYFDLVIKDFQSSSKDLNEFLPKETIPDAIQLPSQLNVKGTFKGTIDNFNTDMSLLSSFGDAKIKATFDQSSKNQEQYDVQTELDNFDFGKLIKNDSIGKITLKAHIKGIGLNPKTATATVNGTILKAGYNTYTYQNLNLDGKISDGLFHATADIKDPNLTFDLTISGSFKDQYPSGKLKLTIDSADFGKLNLYAEPLKLRGILEADIQSANLDFLNGKVTVHHITIATATDQFVLDSINVTAASTLEKNSLRWNSQFLKAEMNGKYKLTKIVSALKNSVAKYYDFNPSSPKKITEQQQFAFKIDIKSSPLLLKFIPELKSLEPINFTGRYNSVNDSIVLNGAIPKLIYGKNTISNAIIKVETKENTLRYSIVVDDIKNGQFQLPYTNISGKAANQLLEYAVQLKDLKDKERYLIAGTLKASNGNNEMSIDPKKLLLNYESWNIASDNVIRFGKNGIYANKFELNKERNSLKIQSKSAMPNAPLALDFSNFKIESLSSITQNSDWEMSGEINGKALIKNLHTIPVFTADLTIEDFTFKKDTVGIINIKVDNEIANIYNAEISISGQENQVNLNGIYKTGDSSFDMNLSIEKLNLKSIQGFAMNQLTESSGFFTGDFKITGTASQPKVMGDLQFNGIGFKVRQLNAKFKSINDKIVFTANAVTFNHFIIKDEKDNKLAINGKINSQNFSNFGFDLAIDAANFKAINSKAKDNDLYYGELYLDNHLRVKGDWNNPIVDGNIKINKDAKFTIVLPQEDPSIADREGVVEFIDQDNPLLIQTIAANDAISKIVVKGINVSVNIEIDKDAELSLIIDKANGDFLKLKGEAQLNGGIDSSGKTTLTGRYELTEGSYEMNFSAIKRKFDIKKGSYILWTGEPTTADINITAIYKTETAPIDLINDQLGNVTAEVRNTYKQKIPFETVLKMKGELMKPSISFDIILPEGNNSVSTEIINATQAKLAQLRQHPDELNKQVFALLLLNRFIGENPFASESGGTSVSTLARESASKILSQQLNNLAGDLINGVDINFDLSSSEDYTTGQLENKTDLNVGISKKLLNDRLKVTVGSSFGIEGPQQINQNTHNIAGDVSLDYQLSKDGKYKLRAYRINKYQVALQGEVVETGIAFIITIDYNKFKELLRSGKEQKNLKKKSDE
ncbi:MAG: translocation/assembly module TamB domain-containing protein [Flavobacteriaceae bacterium]|nr:translocation/assembly module TamB domain-containing protein [Flavobacteriaceae bacterium]